MSLGQEMWMQRLVGEEKARLAGYARGWQYYFGRHEDTLPVKPKQPNDNVKVNFVRLAVDVAVTYLFGQEVEFELDADKAQQSPAEVWLAECWRANHKMLLLQKVAINGAVCGHAFVKIMPGEPHPKLVNLSPEYVAVVTDPHDIDTVVRYLIEYPALGTDGKRLTIRQVIERSGTGPHAGAGWTILDQVATEGGRFETRQEVTWSYAWPPIVDCQNLPSPNEYYGQPDVDEDLLDLNRSLNFVVSSLARIVRYHAHPKTWGKGFKADEMRLAVDETVVLNSPEAELHNLEMQSDLGASLELYKRLKEALHEISQTPEVATGKVDSAGALSGVALQILYSPLVAKTGKKRLTYGALLVELARRLLEMGGFGPQNLCTLHWAELLPGDPLQERQVALLDQQLGVSENTLLTKLGYDADDEAVKRQGGMDDLGEKLLQAFEGGQGGADGNAGGRTAGAAADRRRAGARGARGGQK